MDLKDILLTVFNRDKPPLSEEDIKKNIFIINQFISIKEPIAVAELNGINVDPSMIYHYWRFRYGKTRNVPSWVWTKPDKKIDNKKKKVTISEQAKDIYIKFHSLDKKDIDWLIDNDPQTVKDIKDIEKTIKN